MVARTETKAAAPVAAKAEPEREPLRYYRRVTNTGEAPVLVNGVTLMPGEATNLDLHPDHIAKGVLQTAYANPDQFEIE